MPKISTKNVDVMSGTDQNFIRPLLEPGKHKVKINSVFLRAEKKVEFGERLLLNLETPPVGGLFKGLQVDQADPSKGFHQGQVGNTGYSQYSFKDWTSPSGIFVSKDDEILKAIGTLCHRLGLMNWFDAQNDKHDTVADFVKAFDTEKPFVGIYFHACIGSRQYRSKDGKYLNDDLYIVKDDRVMGHSFGLDEKKVREFFAVDMVSTPDPIPNTPASGTAIASPAQVGDVTLTMPPATPTQEPAKAPQGPTAIQPTSKLEENFLNDRKSEAVANGPGNAELTKSTDPVSNDDELMPWDKPQQ
jgi:hypothetical protein